MQTKNIEKYLVLRKKLLTLRESADTSVYGTKAFEEEDDILAEMDDLWYKHLSEAEIEYLNSLPATNA